MKEIMTELSKWDVRYFLYNWQTLIGSFVGPVLAFLLSIKYQGIKERKNNLRMIEISVTKSINDFYILRAQLEHFIERVNQLSLDAERSASDKVVFLSYTNVPAMREIYRNVEILNFKIKSYYLHNKLLWIDAGIKETNETVARLRNDFEDLYKHHERFTDLILAKNENLSIASKEYAVNLKIFVKVIDEYISKNIPMGIKNMVQAKIYNNHLRSKFGFWFWWWHEGLSFKFFDKQAKYELFANNLDAIHRIDTEIEQEVNKMIRDADERERKLKETLAE